MKKTGKLTMDEMNKILSILLDVQYAGIARTDFTDDEIQELYERVYVNWEKEYKKSKKSKEIA